MKKYFVYFFFLGFVSTNSQEKLQSENDYANYFREVEQAAEKAEALWKTNFYGPILLVDPETKKVFANEPDENGELVKSGDLFTGQLPENMNIANTAVEWNGKRWAMLILPLPEDSEDRINLLSHELFHRVQPHLGFDLHNPENNHLDQRDGRVYLRLELEALKKAIFSESKKEQEEHIRNAIIFRKKRYSVYPEAEKSENQLELNEGLAEYTGFMVSNPTYVRSFAYQTIPVYGYFLKMKNPDWNLDVSNETSLADYFIEEFGFTLPHNLDAEIEKFGNNYNLKSIAAEEQEREEANKKLIAFYKRKFVEEPHLEIGFEQMNISFDPRNMVPIENFGTVYPTIRVTDNWGVLTVENAAMLHSDWSKISLGLPNKTEDNVITGDGWTLELNQNYSLVQSADSQNMTLKKG